MNTRILGIAKMNPITKGKMNFFHSGDLGDVIYALPTIRLIGGGSVYLNTRPWTAEMTPRKVEVLKPLLEIQEYIESVTRGEPKNKVIDMSTFRRGGLPYGVSLVELQADWQGVSPDFRPWLSVDKADPRSYGKVICHRSPRYANPYFPWAEIGELFAGRILVVGHREEAENLRVDLGVDCEYIPTKDYLELARLISSSDLFVGNQSSPMALALGLGVPLIQETCLWVCDCILPRENAEYCYDGGIKSLGIPPVQLPPDIDRGSVPSGGWVATNRSGEIFTSKSHAASAKFLVLSGDFENSDLGFELARQEVDLQQFKRLPKLARRDSRAQVFGLVEEAVRQNSSCH